MVHAHVVTLSRAMAHQDRIIGSYRPKGKVMPKEAVKHLIALLTGRLNVGYPGAPPTPGGNTRKLRGIPLSMLRLGRLG